MRRSKTRYHQKQDFGTKIYPNYYFKKGVGCLCVEISLFFNKFTSAELSSAEASSGRVSPWWASDIGATAPHPSP